VPAPLTTGLDVVMLDGDQRQALVTVRSLSRAGLRVGAFGPGRWAPALRSRGCDAAGPVADAGEDAAGLVIDVLRLAETYRPRVVIPGTDGTVETLRAQRSAVEDRVALALPSEEALQVAVDKERTLALAESIGVPVPRSVWVQGAAEVDVAIAKVGLPAVVKPCRSWRTIAVGGERLTSVVVTTADDARRAVSALAPGGGVVVQEWVGGCRQAISLLRANGRTWARFAQVAHRMFPPLGGSSIVRESISLPADLTEYAEALLAATGLEGYAEVEFRRDASGRPRLMEINPRLSASVEVAVRAGVDFPLLIFKLAAGEQLVQAADPHVGVRMRWLGGDLRWLRATFRHQGEPDVPSRVRALASFAGEFLRPASYDYLHLDDPLPALAATAGFVAAAIRPKPKPHGAITPESV
jgi:predicted ATP-grasp superfamily ATP-dependent carboligase